LEKDQIIKNLSGEAPEAGETLLSQINANQEKDLLMAQLQEKLSACEAENQFLNKRHVEHETLNTQLNEQLVRLNSQLNDQVSKLQADMAEMRKKGEAYAQQFQIQTLQFEEERTALKRSFSTLAKEAEEKDKLVGHLVEQSAAKNSVIVDKDREIVELKIEIAEMQKTKIQLAEKFNSHLTGSEHDVEKLQSKISELTGTLETEHAQRIALQKKLFDSDKILIGYVSENGEKGKEILDLKNSLATMEYSYQLKFEDQEKVILGLRNEIDALLKSKDFLSERFKKLTTLMQGSHSAEDEEEKLM